MGSFKCPMTPTHAIFSSKSFLWNWEVKFDNLDQSNVWLVGVADSHNNWNQAAFWVRYNYRNSEHTARPGRKRFIEVYCRAWRDYTFQLESVGNINAGEWISMTVSYDHATFTSNFFINGQQVPTEDNLHCYCDGCTGPPCVFKNKDGYVPPQNGRLYIAKALDCNHGTFQGQVRNFTWYDFKGGA